MSALSLMLIWSVARHGAWVHTWSKHNELCRFVQEIEMKAGMNYGKITQAYQNAENQALQETDDPHLIVLTMFNALAQIYGYFCRKYRYF